MSEIVNVPASERLITHLRHVDLAVPDYDQQLEFYTDMWGLKPETTDDGLAFLAAEGSPEQYQVRLRKDDEKRLDLISFGAASAADVDAMAERLGTAGHRHRDPANRCGQHDRGGRHRSPSHRRRRVCGGRAGR